MSQESSIRINKYLSEVGYCSRRAADGLLEQKRITINGKIPELGTQVFPQDEVRVDGQLIGKPKQEHVYIAFNKPVGIVSTTDTQGEKDNIIDFIGHPERIFPIGRLDKDSEGLVTAPCIVVAINRFKFRIILTQGLNRQIRRMCAHLGYQVMQLKRIRIMHIQLDLAVGKWRDLSEKELAQLNLLIQDSSKTT